MILDFIAGAAIAALAGMGVGGGGLLVIYTTYAEQISITEARGLNLLFFAVSALAAIPYHLRHRSLPWRTVLHLILYALPGAVLGSAIGRMLSEDAMRRCFGGFLLISGALILWKQRRSRRQKAERPKI